MFNSNLEKLGHGKRKAGPAVGKQDTGWKQTKAEAILNSSIKCNSSWGKNC